MIELFEVTYTVCGILQYKNQNIFNAMVAIVKTKDFIHRYKESGYNKSLDEMKSFYRK